MSEQSEQVAPRSEEVSLQQSRSPSCAKLETDALSLTNTALVAANMQIAEHFRKRIRVVLLPTVRERVC